MRSYTVIAGDSLSEISEKFFGDFNQVNAIAAVNNITDKDVIFPGQVLKIPDTPAAAAAGGDQWMWWMLAGGAGLAAYLVYKRYKAKKKAKRATK